MDEGGRVWAGLSLGGSGDIISMQLLRSVDFATPSTFARFSGRDRHLLRQTGRFGGRSGEAFVWCSGGKIVGRCERARNAVIQISFPRIGGKRVRFFVSGRGCFRGGCRGGRSGGRGCV